MKTIIKFVKLFSAFGFIAYLIFVTWNIWRSYPEGYTFIYTNQWNEMRIELFVLFPFFLILAIFNIIITWRETK